MTTHEPPVPAEPRAAGAGPPTDQAGRCGDCDMGRCDRCVIAARLREGAGRAVTWPVSVDLGGRVVAHLYPVDGQRCRGWVCPCDHQGAEQTAAVPPTASPEPAQDTLFAIGATT